MVWRSKLQQVSVAGSSTLAGSPAMYDVATLFYKCSFPGQEDYSCSLRNFFFFCLVSSLYPSDDYVLSSIRITILINMQEKFLLENLALCFVKDYQTEQPRSLY